MSFHPNGEYKVGNTNIQKIELKRIGGPDEKKESKCKDKQEAQYPPVPQPQAAPITPVVPAPVATPIQPVPVVV